MERLVIHDPARELRQGTVLDKPRLISVAASRRVVLMPVDRDLLADSVGGYFCRQWGEGWLFDRLAGERGCPMLLQVAKERPNIYWCARLQQVGDKKPTGKLKLTTDSSRPQNISGGLRAERMAIQLDHLGPPDKEGGWTVGGLNELNVSVAGQMALSLYAVTRGALVVWSAVSQSRERDSVLGLSG